MNLKQTLIEKATIEEYNIQQKVCDIVEHMQKHAINHEYKITFIRPDRTMAFGSSPQSARTDVFVPKSIKPELYRELFIDEFKKMGFDNEDITLCEGKTNDYNYYNMILRW